MIEEGDKPQKGTLAYEQAKLAKETSDKLKLLKNLVLIYQKKSKEKYVSLETLKEALRDFFWTNLEPAIANKAFSEMDKKLTSLKLTELSDDQKIAMIRHAFENTSLHQWFQKNVLKAIQKTIDPTAKDGHKSEIHMRHFEFVFVDYFTKAYVAKRKQQK